MSINSWSHYVISVKSDSSEEDHIHPAILEIAASMEAIATAAFKFANKFGAGIFFVFLIVDHTLKDMARIKE